MANCSQNLDIIQVRILIGIRGSASAVALLLTVGLLMITRHYAVAQGKKWLKVSLYVLFGSSISYLAVLYVSIFYIIFPSSWSGIWCQIFGFLDQITSILLTGMLLINIHPSVTTIVNYVIYKGHGHAEHCCCRNCIKRRRITRIYVGIILVVTILEMIPSFVPFLVGTYGPFGGWCWISDEENCKRSKKLSTGLWEQIFLWYTIEAIDILICIIIMLTAMGVSIKMVCYDYRSINQGENSHETPENRDSCQKRAKGFGKAIIQLIILVPVNLDIILFGLRASGNNNLPVWVLNALLPPAIAFLIPLSLIFYIQCRQNEAKTTAPLDTSQNEYGTLRQPEEIDIISSSDYNTARERFSSFVEL